MSTRAMKHDVLLAFAIDEEELAPKQSQVSLAILQELLYHLSKLPTTAI